MNARDDQHNAENDSHEQSLKHDSSGGLHRQVPPTTYSLCCADKFRINEIKFGD
jgi:hypothetical protein